MSAHPEFGPFEGIPFIREFRSISEEAERLWVRVTDGINMSPSDHMFTRMSYNAKDTSRSLHLLNSWGLVVPALALLRVRCEQTIVCSYLVHEEISVGLGPFVQHIPINKYLNSKDAVTNPVIRPHLQPEEMNLDRLRANANAAQAAIADGFDEATGKFQRKWTKLDLLSMVKRRDVLAKQRTGTFLNETDPLEPTYLTVYRSASSVVHADATAVSSNFLDIFQNSPDTPPYLCSKPDWCIVAASFCSFLDVVQMSESLAWMEIDSKAEWEKLMHEWYRVRNLMLSSQAKNRAPK